MKEEEREGRRESDGWEERGEGGGEKCKRSVREEGMYTPLSGILYHVGRASLYL